MDSYEKVHSCLKGAGTVSERQNPEAVPRMGGSIEIWCKQHSEYASFLTHMLRLIHQLSSEIGQLSC